MEMTCVYHEIGVGDFKLWLCILQNGFSNQFDCWIDLNDAAKEREKLN